MSTRFQYVSQLYCLPLLLMLAALLFVAGCSDVVSLDPTEREPVAEKVTAGKASVRPLVGPQGGVTADSLLQIDHGKYKIFNRF